MKKILIGFLLLIIIALSGAGFYFSGLILYPNVRGYEETYNLELKNKRMTKAFYDSLPQEEFFIDSSQGYRMHGIFIPAAVPSTRTIIFVHGHTFTLMGSFKYVEMFRSRGFNCLLIDVRYHGRTGGDNCSFGYYEQNDLRDWLDWVISRTGENSVIGIHGESLGATISLMHSIIDDRATFYILDGSTADLTDLLAFRLNDQFGLPSFPLMQSASLMCKIRGGMFFSEVSPVEKIHKVKTPMLFIHGGADKYIPNNHSKRLFKNRKGKARIWICPGAGHSKSVLVDRKGYEGKVVEFLREINIL